METDRIPRSALQLRQRNRTIRQTLHATHGGTDGPSILAKELTDAGLQVLAIERGKFRDTADPANHEVVGTAPALVTQVRQLDQRNVPNLDLDKCRIFETHKLIAQGPMPSRQPFAMMQRMLTLC